ncbi:MAG: LPXTG cell wall anchor domain-containing protein [Deltaproteobacteria bacterium]|nr:LPXTG cell wall anchor domain-containing protein [Deltaproteobacteria bacterium]
MTSQAIVMIFLALLAIAGGIIAYLLKKKKI